MKRLLMRDLEQWKQSNRRKPLLLEGARQVGKTWLANEFGSTHYDKVAYISFFDNAVMRTLFAGDITLDRLIPALSIESGTQITPENTLIIFDEVQEVPRALLSLKTFAETAPQYHILATGSSLGIAIHPGTSFPVGKLQRIKLYPMTFLEFLDACGQRAIADMLTSQDAALIDLMHEKVMQWFKYYLYVGGMPDVVLDFAETFPNVNFAEIRDRQNTLLADYRDDFSKHTDSGMLGPSFTLRLNQVWESLPAQLARENKKFIYGAVRTGGRGRDFELAIQWLKDSSLVLEVPRVSVPLKPLLAYRDADAFKLYCLDVGLLGAMSGLDDHALIEGDTLFREFKGALIEQFVCQQLTVKLGNSPYYWSAANSSGELDFLYEDHGEIVPVEVKAGNHTQAKSLIYSVRKYNFTTAFRFSTRQYHDGGVIKDMPLYMAGIV